MRNKFIYGLALISLVSCTKDFEDMNTDKKNPQEVPAQTLFANAAKDLNRQVATLNVNYNTAKLWSQYISATTYQDEANYDLVNRNIPEQEWRVMYGDILKDLKEAELYTKAEDPILDEDKAARNNRLAIIEVTTVYAYERLTSIFGDVPYSEAVGESNLPKFDNAKTIYIDLAKRLDAAIAMMNVSIGSFDGGYDNLYEGDVASWKMFAYGLKLKMGMTMSDADPAAAQALITSAWSKVMSSNADNASFVFLGNQPNTNPMYEDLVVSGRADFVASNTMVDYMNGLNDPRISAYYTMAPDTDVYIGGAYGTTNSYGLNSHLGDMLHEATLPGNLMDYAEMEFYKAEAIEKGLGTGDAATHYENGIRASIEYWGGSSVDADDYMAQADVDYATAPGDYKAKIGMQAWIAYYNRGILGWTSYRRLDQPVLNVAINSGSPTPTRYTYPTNEQTLNGTNYTKAASAIGGDTKNTKLWWDTN